MEEIHLWPEEQTEHGGYTIVGFNLEEGKSERKYLYYKIPKEFATYITNSTDPYVVASIFTAMSKPARLVVHGNVSPSLISNLDEFQAAWTSWRPEVYTRIEILPEFERERTDNNLNTAIMAFSIGVDSVFSAWRYKKSNHDPFPYSIDAGVTIHGFDFPPQYEETFSRMVFRAKTVLNSIGMTVIPLTTNLRTISHPMEDRHGAFLASCLMFLQRGYRAGIIGSSYPYSRLQLPWGSNPITDRLFSSDTFSIIHDGAGYNRVDKIERIRNWPEAMQNLRVCIGRKPDERDTNCCRCEKCIRTILGTRALGMSLPSCFEHDVSNRQINRLNISKNASQAKFYDDILIAARVNNISGSWIRTLQNVLLRNRIIYLLKKSSMGKLLSQQENRQ